MRPPTPTHLDPMPCADATLECFACGMAIAALVPLALWAAANAVVAALVVAIAAVTLVALVGLMRNGEARPGDEE